MAAAFLRDSRTAWVVAAACGGMAIAASFAQGVPKTPTSGASAIEARVQALEAREDIRKLMHDYGRLLDQRDYPAFAQLFASQSEYDSGGVVTRGPENIAGFLQDVIGRNPAGFGTPNFHVFFNETIDVQGNEATATSKSAFMVPGEGNRPSAVILASYHDVFTRENGRWKFLRRVVRSDIPAPKPKS